MDWFYSRTRGTQHACSQYRLILHFIGIENQLNHMKNSIHVETHRLSESIDNMLKHVDDAWEQTSPLLHEWKSYANQLWFLGLSATLMTLLVPLTLSIGMLLGETDFCYL